MRQQILLGRYEIIHEIGKGGMGRVFLARQLDLPRQVVIKLMREEVAHDLAFRQRFEQEMYLLARFQHPYAVTLYDATLDSPEGPCLVMEYVRGQPLDEILRREKHFSPVRVGRLLAQLCEVLQAAHNLGILHRDLKPANIMLLEPDTPYEKVKILDFGLAELFRWVGSPVAHGTETALIGTPNYMSPEQIRNETLDHRSDLYSLGVIVYEMLTGRLPFEGETAMDMLLAHTQEQPSPMSQGVPFIHPAIESVVLKCLAKRPEDRPNSAWELNQLYQEALRQSQEVSSPSSRSDGHLNPDSSQHVTPTQTLRPRSPLSKQYVLEAWMPQALAAYKIQGFVADMRGEICVQETQRVVLRLGGKNTPYDVGQQYGLLQRFLGRSSRPFEVELVFETLNEHGSRLRISVFVTYVGRLPLPHWEEYCDRILQDLRGYLIGQTVFVSQP
ncbi:MAG: serine/threonine-protein kinase [Gemmatales bacterium]|nr:serine/threonine protein kinase [Gemmatales bacterium]MDW7994396.1 serine/threonine-protein kinase [Gemmatales bacterium]